MFHTPGRSRPPTQTFRESLDAHGGVCLFRRAAGGLALLLLAASAHAATIPLFNTGVDGNGNPLAPGASDPHWQLIAGEGVTAPVPAVVVSEQHPSGQYFETTDSMWIWTDASGNGANTPYTFRLSFDLTGFDPGSVSISGFWGIDDTDGAIMLNGAAPEGSGLTLTPTSFDNFNIQHPFSITGGFVAGINFLDITARDVSNPGALNVTGLSVLTTPVPEPGAAVLFGIGALALAVSRRPRRYSNLDPASRQQS